jgi:hypothetical protein
MVYDKHFVSSPRKDTTSPTSSASSESSEDYIPGRDLLETERYTRFQRELAQRIASYQPPTDGLAPPVALRVALPIRISTQAREDEGDYEEDGMYPRDAEHSIIAVQKNTVLMIYRRRRMGRRIYPRLTRHTSRNTP